MFSARRRRQAGPARALQLALAAVFFCALLALPLAARSPAPPDTPEAPHDDCSILRPLRTIVKACSAVLAADPRDGRALGLRANAYRKLGEWRAAAADLDAALAIDPRDMFALSRRVIVNSLRGRHDLAQQDIDLILLQPSETASDLEAKALALSADGRRAKALAALDDALAKDPDHVLARLGRAMLYRHAGRHREAVADAEIIAARHPGFAYGQLVLGLTLVEAPQIQRAADAFDAAVRLDPGDPSPLQARATLHVFMGKPDLADRDLTMASAQSATPLCPKALRAVLRTARFGLGSGVDDIAYVFSALPADEPRKQMRHLEHICVGTDAEANYSRRPFAVLRSLPDRLPPLWAYMADQSALQRRWDDVIAHSSRAIAATDYPTAPWHAGRADAYLALGLHEAALKDASRAVEITRGASPDYLWRRARIHNLLGDRTSAILDETEASRLQGDPQPSGQVTASVDTTPKPATVAKPAAGPAVSAGVPGVHVQANHRVAFEQHLADARQHMRGGRYSLALVALDKAVALQPEDASPYSLRAITYAALNDSKRSAKDIAKLVSLDPSGRAAHTARCGSHMMLKAFAQALPDCNKMIELGDSSGSAHTMRGQVHYQLRSWANAEADFAAVLRSTPGDTFARMSHAISLIMLGKGEEALSDLNRVLQNNPQHEYGIRLMRLLTQPSSESRGLSIKTYKLADASCGDTCPEWLSIEGTIQAGDAVQVQAALNALGNRKLPVFLNSGGGSSRDGDAIGRAFRKHGLDVYVTWTEPVACPASPAVCQAAARRGVNWGRPHAKLAACASACVSMLAGGVTRGVGPRGVVGVHQAAYGVFVDNKFRHSSKKIGESFYVGMKDYLEEMGVDSMILNRLMTATFSQMHWMNRTDMTTSRLVTTDTSGEKLLTGTDSEEIKLWPGSAQKVAALMQRDMSEKK